MEIKQLEKISETQWQVPRSGPMRVPAIIYGTEELLLEMDQKVLEQISNVAALPGIVEAAYAMPDAHWGYGFPIGGVAAFDPDDDGVVSAGGVGFDISCGVRLLRTSLTYEELMRHQKKLADALFREIPSGVGSTGRVHLNTQELDAMLRGGARWAVEREWGEESDLERIEDGGSVRGASAEAVSDKAKARQRDQMGTLGSGNHYLEVQRVAEVLDESAAQGFGLKKDQIVISIHCGSRGLGHQIATDFLSVMVLEAKARGIQLAERELACAPIKSSLGEAYLGAMRAGINCALANRQIITKLVRDAFRSVFQGEHLPVVYDVSHNTCKEETHLVGGKKRKLFVHRKGATRAFGPGNPELPPAFRQVGQPVIIGGSMGTSSYVLVGTEEGSERSFNSACHGAGRVMSRTQALKTWQGKEVIQELASRNILIRSGSTRGVAEEAPGAYKDVSLVVESTHQAGLARKVVKLEPVVCVKG